MTDVLILCSVFGVLALLFFAIKRRSDKVRKQMMKELDEVSND